MYRLNVRIDNSIVSYLFPTISDVYQYVLDSVATDGDRKYYRDLCGLELEDVKSRSEDSKNAILRNVFENVVLVEQIDNTPRI